MNGILNVYKEKGYTSHDVVAKLRGICRQKKIGHTGTLDPDAEGVLPACLGTATKVCGLLAEKDKEYEAVLLLGRETDTQDTGGRILKEVQVTCTQEEAVAAARSFAGAYSQIPPMYSALKANGKKLCDLARQGIEIERQPRTVQIYQIDVLWADLPRMKLRVRCSKGTYIRTLCSDIGKKLGCGGCMEELLRTQSGIFRIGQAVKLAQIEQMAKAGRLTELLLPPDCLFPDYPKAGVTAEFVKMLHNGNRLPRRAFVFADGDRAGNGQKLRVYLNGCFYGIYMPDEGHGDYRPEKIFGQRDKT